MSNAELSISELRRKRAQSADESAGREEGSMATAVVETAPLPSSQAQRPAPRPAPRRRPEPEPEPSFDRSRFVAAILRNWLSIALALLAGGGIGGAIGFARANYSVLVTLTLRDLGSRFDGPDGVSYKPPRPSSQAMINFLTSSELLNAVASRANPPMSERALAKQLDVSSEKGSENIDITITGKDPQKLIDLANLYSETAVALSREAQQEDPALMYTNLTSQLAEIERQQTGLNQRFVALRTNSGIADPLIESPAFEKEWVDLRVKIDLARGELASLKHKARVVENEPLQRRLQDANAQLLTYRSQGKLDEHPDVKRLVNEIADLNRQLSADATDPTKPVADSAPSLLTAVDHERSAVQGQIQQLQSQADAVKAKLDNLYASTSEYNQLKSELERLDVYKRTLNNRRFEAQQYRDNAEGYFHPPAAPVSLKHIDPDTRYRAAAGGAGRGGVFGLLLSLGLVLLVEYIDPRLKTAADVKRITELPVLATLGDLNRMDDEARKAWAFRTWTILSGTLAQSANRGTVCGFISCAHREGRSTWVEMLVGAAKERGFEVIKLDFNNAHLAEHPATANETSDDQTPASDSPADPATNDSTALLVRNRNQSLMQAKQPSVIHIELPGMVWDLDRRIQFQNELEQWQSVSRSVILVDLPPACVPEAVLLAENLPQLIWLVDAGKSHARETRLHLETLRHARCKLVGAVLNHEPEPLINL